MTAAETLQKLAERRLRTDPDDVLGQFFADASERARQRENKDLANFQLPLPLFGGVA